MATTGGPRSFAAARSLWVRVANWLGLDRSEPVDLLDTDPVRHFQEWDRNTPRGY